MARNKRNDFMAGIFILVSLAALIGVLILIHDWKNYGGPEPVFYHVEFPQTGGVKVNSPVLLGGSVIGRVAAVEPRWPVNKKTNVESLLYDFTLQVPPGLPLKQDAQIRIESKLIGEGGAVNIFNIGSGEPATEKTLILGQTGDVMSDATAVMADMKAVIADFRYQTAPKINDVVTNISNVTSGLSARMPQIGRSIDNLESSIAGINKILDDNRANVKSSIANIESLTQSAKVSVPIIFDNLSGASADIRTLIAANRMNLSDTMVNLRQTSEQLKAASEEIRRAPWRLLYKPEKREADTLNIYDASRSYADAASDLNSAAMTLETLMKLKKDGTSVDEKALAEALDRVKAGLGRYSQAEDALWKQWGAASGANGKP